MSARLGNLRIGTLGISVGLLLAGAGCGQQLVMFSGEEDLAPAERGDLAGRDLGARDLAAATVDLAGRDLNAGDLRGATVPDLREADLTLVSLPDLPLPDLASTDLTLVSLPDIALPSRDLQGLDLQSLPPIDLRPSGPLDLGPPDLLPALDLSLPVVDLAGLPVPDLSLPVEDLAGLPVLDLSLPVEDLAGLPVLDLALPVEDLAGLPVLDIGTPDLRLPPLDLSPRLDILRLPDLRLPDLAFTLPIPDLAPARDLEGADLVVLGPRCPAVLFDGDTALMTAAPIAALNPLGPITVEAWIYPRSFLPEMVIAGHTANAATGTASYYLALDSVGHVQFNVSTTGFTYNTATSTVPVSTDQWTHVAGVYDPSTTRIEVFIAGALDGTDTPVIGLPSSIMNVPLHVGRFSTATPATDGFDGYIDEVRFSSAARYTTAFTPAASFTNDTSTIALYHFDETSGQTANDASSNANVGALQLTAVFANAPVCQ